MDDQRERLRGVFDRTAPTYDAVGVEFFKPIGRRLVRELSPQPGERALDVGCGRGAGARRRFGVASAEVSHMDSWSGSVLGFAAVSGSAGHVAEVVDGVERFVWSFPEVEVVAGHRRWLETED